MSLTEYTMRLLMLGIPGIICYFIVGKLIGNNRKRSSLEIILIVFSYSILSYVLLFAFKNLCGIICDKEPIDFVFFKWLTDTKEVLNPKIIFQACVGSILAALIVSYLAEYEVINRIGRLIKATTLYGDESVWNLFNKKPLEELNNGWLLVHDTKNDIIYYGSIHVFSDFGDDRELIMKNVCVYRGSDLILLYHSDMVYLSRKSDALTILATNNILQWFKYYEHSKLQGKTMKKEEPKPIPDRRYNEDGYRKDPKNERLPTKPPVQKPKPKEK